MFNEEDYTFEAILERMLATIPDTIDKREGSIIYDALAPAATELAQNYIWLQNALDLVFVDTAVDEYLDRLCNQIGIIRKEATKTIKKGTFYDGDNNLMNVEMGSRFTCQDLYWEVIEKISDGIFKLQCETAGVLGNNVTGSLIPVDYIQGLGTAELTELLIPGEDEEDDETLREKYFEQTRERAFGGNIADYKAKTKAIDGVGAVKVTPIWNGGGTVKLTILDSEYNKASNSLIGNVQNAICPNLTANGLGLAPIGHVVTVDTATEEEISVSATITTDGQTSQEQIENSIEQAIEGYLLSLREDWENSSTLIVRKARIEALILGVEGVIDVEDVTLNEEEGNITLEGNEIPVLQEVVIE